MGLLSDLALGGIERIEQRLGKRAALSATLRLIESSAPGPARAEAMLRAAVYAAELADGEHLGAIVVRWEFDGAGPHGPVRRAIKAVIGSGLFEDAALLAGSELTRQRGSYDEPSAHYALGRALEAKGDADAAVLAYDRAAEVGADQPRLCRTAKARAVWVRLTRGPRSDAIDRAERLLPLRDGLPEERLWVAVAALGSPGRYRRSSALDELGALVEGPLASSVLAFAARHATLAGISLTHIEADRLEALFARAGVDAEAARERLVGWLDLAQSEPGAATRAARSDPETSHFLARAKAVLEGAPPGPRPETPRALSAWLGLRIVHAHRQERPLEVRAALDEACAHVRAGARTESALWTAAALTTPAHPERGAALIEALIDGPGEPPPRGYGGMALAAERAGRPDLSIRLLRVGAELREPGTRERLAMHARARGWEAAERGERYEAIAHLREAKRLS